MPKHWKLLIAFLAVFGLIAASCGDDDDSGDGDDAAEDDTADDSGDDMMDDSGALITLEEECETYEGLEAPEGFTVNLVTDIGKIDDGTFNQFAYEGMQGALDCFGIEESNVIETVSEADYDANIATSLGAEPNVLVTVGFLLADATAAAAAENADVNFIGIDQFQPEYPSNMIGVLFNEHEGGFIAGAFAAALTESDVVGVVGGREDVPPVVKFVNGYRAGAESINPDIRVLEIYNESFTDPAKGASDAEQFIGEGADVIFGAGGPTGSGGVKAAAEAGVWAIGVDQDEYFTTFSGGEAPGSENLATSAIKRVDLAVFRNIAAAIEGSFAGGIYSLTAENLGITYAPFHDAAVSDEAATVIEETRAGLADGSIETGVCGIDGLFLGTGSACEESTDETTTTTEGTEESTTTTEAPAEGGGEASFTVDGGETVALTVSECSSADESSIDVVASGGGTTVTVSATGGAGSITVSGDSEAEGTVDSVSVGDDGTFTVGGIVTPADDSATESPSFTFTGTCAA